MNVSDVMTPREEVVTVELPGSREDALEYLQERAFSSVPAIKHTDDGEVFRGIVSRKSLIERPDEDQLALLAQDVPTTAADATIAEVADLMVTEGERRIPVVSGDELVGIVTVTDIVHAIARGEANGDRLLETVASREINAVYEGTPLPTAERELSFAGVPYAVALDDHGELAGILTEVDILEVARVVEGEDATGDSIANQDDEWAWEGIKATGNRYMPTRNVELPTGPVSEFMTEDVLTLSQRRTVRDAAQAMIEEDIEQIPVLSGDELVGIVQDMNLLEALR
jgi:IMP dehydrogenase